MLKGVLSEELNQIICEKVNWKTINELRLRANKPIVLNIGSNKFFLSTQGVTSNLKDAIYASKTMIEDIIFRASEFSIYSVNEQIKRGFIMTKQGIRIGIGGNIVEENGVIKTMTNFSSLNIRIPHDIRNCSLKAFGKIFVNNQVLNTLIISPPGAGKTTFLKDFVWQLSDRNYAYNILVIDERGELDSDGKSKMGNFCDVISFAGKKTAFENGIRSLSPDIIITDELAHDDISCVKHAVNSGISVVATAHSNSLEELAKKPEFAVVLQEKTFKRFILLSTREGPGTLEGIYDENFSRIQNFV